MEKWHSTIKVGLNIFLYFVFSIITEPSDVSQPVSVRTLKLGESATIECFLKSVIYNRVWYKLTAERRLQVVATYSSRYNWSAVVDELKHRYSVNSNGINNHLTISAASWDDAGTYFCGVLRLNDIQFGSGTLLMLQGIHSSSETSTPTEGEPTTAPPPCVDRRSLEMCPWLLTVRASQNICNVYDTIGLILCGKYVSKTSNNIQQNRRSM
uniref:Ig-like domain-containing protein n=1 Tax=Xiphophorus couchianus TaxID=32473 RepID=A0A3B5L210_9TELE